MERKYTEEFEEKCISIFAMFDLDGDGNLTKEEILKGHHMFNLFPTDSELNQTMEKYGIKKDASSPDSEIIIDLENFKKMMFDVDKDEEVQKVRQAFRKCDRHKRGYLDKKQFSAVINAAVRGEKGNKFTKEEIDEFFRLVDTDSNGEISMEEFVVAFTSDEDIFASIRKPEYEIKEEQEQQQQQQQQIPLNDDDPNK